MIAPRLYRSLDALFRLSLACTLWLGLGLAGSASAQEESIATEDIQRRAVLSAARNSLERDDISGAVVFYERYLEMMPGDRAVALELAGVLVHDEQFEPALDVLDLVLTRDPSNPEGQRLRAMALSRIGHLAEAIEIAERLALRFPEDTEIRRLVAGFRAMRGDSDSVRDIHREWEQTGVQSTADWEVFMQLLATDEQWDWLLETFEEYRDHLETTDNIRLAAIRARLARYETAPAQALFQEMETESGQRAAALLIADQLAAARRLNEAIQFLEPVARAWPGDAGLARRLALIYAYDHRPVEAVAVLARIPAEGRDDRIRVVRAEIYKAAGQPYEALRELDRMAAAGQYSVRAALTRAGVLYDLHREWEIPAVLAGVEDAAAGWEEAERKLAWTLTALAHIRAGDGVAARRVIERFRARAPRDPAPDILETLAAAAERRTYAVQDAAARLGMTLRVYRPGLDIVRPVLLMDVPADAWKAAWHLDPENYPALIWWADATFELGLIEEADELYQLAAQGEATRADALLGRIACALRLEEERAVDQWLPQIKGLPLRFDQQVRAARLLLRAGRDGQAEYFISAIDDELARHPDTVAVRAAWLLRSRRGDEARSVLAQPEPRDPAGLGAMVYQLYRMGALARDADDPVYAVAVERLLALGGASPGPAGLDALLPAADLMIQYNRYSDARDVLSRAERNGPGDLRVAERAMVADIRLGHYEQAERHVRAIQRRRPMAVEPRQLLARIKVWRTRYEAAWADYRALIADYPHDEALVHEYEAKHSMALGRHRKAAQSYGEWLALQPGDREAQVERADSYLSRDLARSAADGYRRVTVAYPYDGQARASLRTAEQRTAWGTYGALGFDQRRGRDGAVDIRQESVEVGVLFPRGPDGMQLGAGLQWLRWDFDDAPDPDRRQRANEVRLHGTQQFHNGVEARGEFKLVDDRIAGSAWHAELDVGYRGLEGWKAAVIAGREVVRDNYYTIADSLPRTWLGAYGQWQPLARLELFGQVRVINTGRPTQEAALPSRALVREGFSAAAGPVLQPSPAGLLGDALARRAGMPPATRQLVEDTYRTNKGYEAVLDGHWTVFFFPRSLRLWVNGYVYDTQRDSLLYWTPDDTFFSGQVGVHWRHAPWQVYNPAGRSFFYGASAGAGRDSESDSFGSLLGELGWVQGNGFSLHAEAGGVWSANYDVRQARLYGAYRF